MEKYFELKNKYTNYNIKAKMCLPKRKNGIKNIFIICHGFFSFKESTSAKTIARKLNDNNIAAISFDFPAHGESPVDASQLTIENCIYDIKTIEDYIKDNFKDTKMSIFGSSFGGYIILNKIIKDGSNFENIVLRAPAIDMKNIIINSLGKEEFEKFKKAGFIEAGFDRQVNIPYSFYLDLCNNDVLKQYNKKEKILIFHGVDDDTALIKDTYEFIKKDPQNIRLIAMDGVNHKMDIAELEFIADEMIKYMK